jgi:hypothetical protein
MHGPWQALLRVSLLLPITVAAGCRDSTAPEENFRFAGNWAGSAWRGQGTAVFVRGDGSDTLYLIGNRRLTAGEAETIRVSVPFQGSGTYKLGSTAVSFTVIVGGDQIWAEYMGRSPTAGTLVVESYDEATGLITGSVAFEAAATLDYRPYGAAARFEAGRFRGRVRRVH